MAQAQVVEQGLHDRRMARIADGAVVEVAHLASQGLAQGAEAARGVEGLIGDAVEGEFLQLFQRRGLTQLAIDDGFAGFAIFVDDPVRAPGQIVVQGVGGETRQGADAHAHVLQGVEILGQVVGDDGDEAGRQAALGDEGGLGVDGQLLDPAGRGHVLGQVQIVGAGGLGRFGDLHGQVIGGGAEHGELALQGRLQRIGVGDIQHALGDRGGGFQPVELLRRAIDDFDAIVTATGQEIGDHRTDLAAAHDGDVFHVVPSEAER